MPRTDDVLIEGTPVDNHTPDAAEPEVCQLATAIGIGLHAAAYMAQEIAFSARDMDFVGIHDKTGTLKKIRSDHVDTLRTTLRLTDRLMQHLGDAINAREGCTVDDESATRHAFSLVRRVLKHQDQAKGK